MSIRMFLTINGKCTYQHIIIGKKPETLLEDSCKVLEKLMKRDPSEL